VAIDVRAAIGSLLFLAVAPGVVAGLIPWWLTRWEVEEPLALWAPLRVVGLLLIAAGVLALLDSFRRFVVEGFGTPAPVAPTAELVVGGLDRYVRNPMYIAVAVTIFGQALLLGRGVLVAYAAVFVAVVAAFVHWYEEPTLARTHGEQYHEYRRSVPGWIPRRPR
jgi:protein-S-isoprenylcysteine O-methyltransferase Ste14